MAPATTHKRPTDCHWLPLPRERAGVRGECGDWLPLRGERGESRDWLPLAQLRPAPSPLGEPTRRGFSNTCQGGHGSLSLGRGLG